MRIRHDSLTETTNPETLALLRLTSTPSTNVSVQVDERNGGANDGPSEILALPAPENSTKNLNSKNSKDSNLKPNRQNNNGNHDKGQTSPHFRYPNSQPHCLTPTPTHNDEKTSKPRISVKFSDKPMKINRELSQTRGPKTKRPKFQNKGTRRSP